MMSMANQYPMKTDSDNNTRVWHLVSALTNAERCSETYSCMTTLENPLKTKNKAKKVHSLGVWGGEFCGLRNYTTKNMAWEYLVRVVFHQKLCYQHIKSSTELYISAVLICTFYYTSGWGGGTLTLVKSCAV